MKVNTPKRRFKGFSEDWEQEKLSNVANIVGGGTPSTKESSYWNGDINWFTPNEIGDSKYVKDSLRRITEKGLNNSSVNYYQQIKQSFLLQEQPLVLLAYLKKKLALIKVFSH